MCNNLCNKCGTPQCEKVCTCTSPNYSENKCELPVDFKCVILEPTSSTYPCLDFEEGDSLKDLLDKVESLKCSFDELPLITPKDENVKTDSTDTVSGFLADKIIGNECISWESVDQGGNVKFRPLIDFACVLDKIITLPLFCATVINCVNSLPPQCNQIGSILLTNTTSDSLSYSIIPGLNNTSFVYSLYLDATFTTVAAPSQTLTSTLVTFTGLNPSTLYWLKVQPICVNGGSANYSGFGPNSTSAVVNNSCPTITLNTPVIVNDVMSVSWVGGVGATSYNVYINNTLVSNQTTTSYISSNLPNGNYIVKVEALPCSIGTPQSDSETFIVNYSPLCIPPSNVVLNTRSITNICPSTTVNLNSLIALTPLGVVVEWFLDPGHTMLISTPNSFSIPSNISVYVFTKNILTNCYSDPIEVAVSLTTCNSLPFVTLNCVKNVTVISGSFIKDGTGHNGTISIPVTVLGSGNIFGTVSGNGFSGAFSQFVNNLTTDLIIGVTYDGIGGLPGNNAVTVSVLGSSISNDPQTCSTGIPVICPPCDAPLIDISAITSTGFITNVLNLLPGDMYSITITRLVDNTILDFANNLVGSYVFTSGASLEEYIVSVTRSCSCGNFTTLSVNVTTL